MQLSLRCVQYGASHAGTLSVGVSTERVDVISIASLYNSIDRYRETHKKRVPRAPGSYTGEEQSAAAIRVEDLYDWEECDFSHIVCSPEQFRHWRMQDGSCRVIEFAEDGSYTILGKPLVVARMKFDFLIVGE